MRRETITRTLYTFDELSETAKQKAIEKLWDINVDYEWWNGVYDDAEQVGLEITEFDLDRNRYTKGNFIESAEETAHSIVDNHGEQCETYKTAQSYLKERDNLIDNWPKDEDEELENEYELDGKLDDLDSEFLKSILEDYSISLQKYYDYLTSEEAIKETINANEYEFTEDGEIA